MPVATRTAQTDTRKQKPRRPQHITDKQRVFIKEYAVDKNGVRAVKAAGYAPKHADKIAAQLLDGKTYPLVAAAVLEEIEKLEKSCEMKAIDVLRHIHTAIRFNPLRFFEPGGNGGWLVKGDLSSLPDSIGCLIEEIEMREIEKEGTKITRYWVKLVDKTTMIALAAKHQLTPLNKPGDNKPGSEAFDWDRIYEGPDEIVDEIENVIDQAAIPYDPNMGKKQSPKNLGVVTSTNGGSNGNVSK